MTQNFEQSPEKRPIELKTIISKLQGTGVVDVCIASNIIEVGVDIDRLGLMAIVGQPKTTAQYIQVSGRVGRRWWERPGLVVTIYSAAKPRDRSHYEHFRAYHQRLYTQVEPASVTPWSLPAVERALAAVCVGYMRQKLPSNVPLNAPQTIEKLNKFIDILLEKRRKFMSASEAEQVEEFLTRKAKEWKKRMENFQAWGDFSAFKDGNVIYALSDQISDEVKRHAWPAPMSMRNVDGVSNFSIVGNDPYAAEEKSNESD